MYTFSISRVHLVMSLERCQMVRLLLSSLAVVGDKQTDRAAACERSLSSLSVVIRPNRASAWKLRVPLPHGGLIPHGTRGAPPFRLVSFVTKETLTLLGISELPKSRRGVVILVSHICLFGASPLCTCRLLILFCHRRVYNDGTENRGDHPGWRLY